MTPTRLKVWLLVWTPLVWLTLELVRYPKDHYVSQGIGRLLAGFVGDGIGAYPAWSLLLAAMCVMVVAAWLCVQETLRRRLGIGLLALGCVCLAWGVAAGLGGGSWSLAHHTGSFGWLFQSFVVALLPVVVVLWVRTAPERAQLVVGNLHHTWRLFRANWQGLCGVTVLVVFVLVALLAPFIAAHSSLDPNAQVARPFSGPHWSYYRIFGTDEQGLSLWSEFVWSARISLVVGLLATLISTVVGTIIGVGSGFFGGWRGVLGMRTTDIFLVLPWLPFAMVLAAAWGRNYGIIILIIGITCWPGTARLVRAETLKVRELQFVERARAIGSSSRNTVMRHILPNVMPLIFANTVLVVAIAILSETTLSFLGLGDPMNFSWGTMLRNAWLSGAAGLPEWAYLIAPGASIVLVVLAFTFVGQALDAVLDPKLRRRDTDTERIDERGQTGPAAATGLESSLDPGPYAAQTTAAMKASLKTPRIPKRGATPGRSETRISKRVASRVEHEGILDVRDLKVHFRLPGGWVKAVDGISFSLAAGESLGLAGESGCGKTTAAMAILQLLPDNGRIVSGKVLFDGSDLARRTEYGMGMVRWKQISMIFQGAMNALNPVQPVGAQIIEPIRLHDPVSEKQATERARELFDLVGISPKRINEYPHQMSGGMRQRAMIAMALACNPKLIIGDEPTTALDVMVQAQILELIERLREELGLSFILISHDLSVMAETCEKGVIMYAGKVVESGSAKQIFNDAQHPYTRRLIKSFPDIEGEREMVSSIPGDPPNLLYPPPGCNFSPRCEGCLPLCREIEPQLVELDPGHFVACHLFGSPEPASEVTSAESAG
jgi:oligopeptide/dipeptide ABC transporter ATP-binding protein